MKIIRFVTLLLASFSMSGCVPAAIAYGGSRSETKGVIGRYAAQTMPEVSSADAAECIIAGMTYKEVLMFGNSSMSSGPPQNAAMLKAAMARPEVKACLAALPKQAAN